MLVKMGTVTQGLCKSLNVSASYINCVTDFEQGIDIYSSYDCSGYPDLSSPAGGNYKASILDIIDSEQPLQQEELILRYKNADMHWTINNTGPPAVDLCTTIPFEIDIQSVLQGEMNDLELTVDIPDHASLESAQFLYPANEGSPAFYIDAPGTFTSDGKIKFDISSDEILGGGLPGPQTFKNELKFQLNFSTSCGFDPGVPITYTLNGTTNCGDFKTLSDQKKIQLNGVNLDDLDVQVSATSFTDCNSGNQMTTIITNQGDQPSSAGAFKIILDPNVQYTGIVSGDITGTPTENLTSKGRELVWDLPAGFVAAGATKQIVIGTQIGSTNDFGDQILYYAKTSMLGVATCTGTPCEVNATTAEGNYYLDVTDIFPQVEIVSDQLFPVCKGSTFLLTAQVNGNSSSPGYSFKWGHTPLQEQAVAVRGITEETSYNVIVTNPSGCSTLATITVPVAEGANDLSDIKIHAEKDCENGEVALYVKYDDTYKYQWSKDNVPISGANGATFFATTPGIYSVQVMVDGCGTSAKMPVILDGTMDPSFTINDDHLQLGEYLVAIVNTPITGATYTWSFGDGNTRVTSTPILKYQYRSTGDFAPELTVSHPTACNTFNASKNVSVYDPLCESDIPVDDGQFYMDKVTGRIVFRKSNCPGDVLLSCIAGERDPNSIVKVVSATATTYSDDWSYDGISEVKSDVFDLNAFEKGESGKWRVKSTYTYKEPLHYEGLNYKDGTFRMESFNWEEGVRANSSKWVRASSIEAYSANGEAVQETNALHIPSTVKMGYGDVVPYLTATNAAYNTVEFESFEEWDSADPNLEQDIIHSGSKAYQFKSEYSLPEIVINEQVRDHGLLLKAWVYNKDNPGWNVTGETMVFGFKDKFSNQRKEVEATAVANVEGWTLYSAKIMGLSESEWAASDKFSPYIKYSNDDQLIIDDIRVQPVNSEMTAYVYDPSTLKLLTVFDSQHFGLYYQYNPEGKLIRKAIETEEGKKTIQETHYNTPKIANPFK